MISKNTTENFVFLCSQTNFVNTHTFARKEKLQNWFLRQFVCVCNLCNSNMWMYGMVYAEWSDYFNCWRNEAEVFKCIEFHSTFVFFFLFFVNISFYFATNNNIASVEIGFQTASYGLCVKKRDCVLKTT